jgi:hypothetical protein
MILAVLFANSDGNILIERCAPSSSPTPPATETRTRGISPLLMRSDEVGLGWDPQVPWGPRGGEAPLALLPGEARFREPQGVQERGAPRCFPQVSFISLPIRLSRFAIDANFHYPKLSY